MTERTARHDRGRRRRRFLLGGLLTGALALSMSGCILIKSNSSTQLQMIGNAQITTTACASDTNSNNSGYNPADPACQGSGKGGNYPGDAGGATAQYKIAYRIPTTVTAPSNFTSTAATCNSGITFNQSSSYSNALESLSPAGSGKQWVGYLSTTQSYTTAGCQYFTVSPQFTLNQGANGSPFQGPFNYRVVVGFRHVDEATPGSTSSRTVTCGNGAITDSYTDGADANADGNPDMEGICADDPTPATISGADLSQATKDLGVIPTNTSVHAGATATVPFNLKYAGAAGASFSVAASTNVPGTSATPSITSLTPSADSDNNMNATVNVPAGTTPGSYTVTVTATGTGGTAGQSRQGTATLTVGNSFDFDVAPNVPNMPGVTLNGQAQTKTAQMSNFAVNDTSGAAAGWNVTVQGNSGAGLSNVFKQYCSNGSNPCGSDSANSYVAGGRTLPANSLTLNTTGASWTGGGGSAPTFSCNAGCAVDRSTAIKAASASLGGGTALWSTTGFGATSLSLAIPSTLRVLPANEIYRLDVLWTLSSGP